MERERLGQTTLRYLFCSDAEGSPHPHSPYRGAVVCGCDAARARPDAIREDRPAAARGRALGGPDRGELRGRARRRAPRRRALGDRPPARRDPGARRRRAGRAAGELVLGPQRQLRCNRAAAVDLVDHVDAVVLAVGPGDAEEEGEPAPEPEAPLAGEASLEDELAAFAAEVSAGLLADAVDVDLELLAQPAR